MGRRLVNVLDAYDGMTDREAMLGALDLISKAAPKDEASPDEIKERLEKCIDLAQGALRYVTG